MSFSVGSCYVSIFIYSDYILVFFFFSSRRRHTRCLSDWSSDVCSSDLTTCRDRQRHPPQVHMRDLSREPSAVRLHESQRFVGLSERPQSHDLIEQIGEIGRASCRERV